MNKLLMSFLLYVSALSMMSCDSGSIEEVEPDSEQGRIVKIEGQIEGLKTWPRSYDISVAGFRSKDDSEASPYATIAKVITTDEHGNMSIVLSGMGSDVHLIEICVLNQLRRRVMKFVSEDISKGSINDTIRLNVGKVDVSMMNAIQVGMFNGLCATCHNTKRPAANLDLTAGHSYASLVNHTSTKVPTSKRIAAGDVKNSILHKVLNTDISNTWGTNHPNMLNSQRTEKYLLRLIDDWIKCGAPK